MGDFGTITFLELGAVHDLGKRGWFPRKVCPLGVAHDAGAAIFRDSVAFSINDDESGNAAHFCTCLTAFLSAFDQSRAVRKPRHLSVVLIKRSLVAVRRREDDLERPSRGLERFV